MKSRVVNLDTNLVPTPDALMQEIDVSTDVEEFEAFDAATTHVLIGVDGGTVRVTFDGSAPTTTHGLLLGNGSNGTWNRRLADAAKFIRQGSTDAHLAAQELTEP